MKKYPSKISFGLLALILLVLVGSTIPIITPPNWPGVFINLAALIFILYLYSQTYYVIDGHFLKVRAGFLVNKKIDINQVHTIRETRSLLSAPALSLDRIEVNWSTNKAVVISPKNKKEFIEEMLRVNPKIETFQK
ncbi:PH domain-containing protein [Pareuzebyella sediminis]|uniref:PH domain-containing protein n=1 Tax=Pareuzebyella sediminis TaxID=2607998 RepID=UPI0011EDB6A7|nr:PH domain-containing protein [Pareuzebyella sediminis]